MMISASGTALMFVLTTPPICLVPVTVTRVLWRRRARKAPPPRRQKHSRRCRVLLACVAAISTTWGFVLHKLVRAGRLDRTLYASLVNDDYATGNAVVVAAVVGLLPGLGRSAGLAVFWAPLRAIILVACVSLALRAAAVHLYQSQGSSTVAFRLVGFAAVAGIPLGVDPWTINNWILWPSRIIAVLWFFLALRVIARVQFALGHPDNSLVAGAGVLGGYLGWILLPWF